MKKAIKIFVVAITVFATACSSKTTTEQSIESPIEIKVATMSETNPNDSLRSVVFLTGYDRVGETYYSNAKDFFQKQDIEIVESAYSLQEIILWLNINYNNQSFSNIHIVNNNMLNRMSLETVIKGDKLTAYSLRNAIDNQEVPVLDDVLAVDSRLVFHTNGLGSNVELMNQFKSIFTTDVQPSVMASEHASIFGSEFAPQYLAKTYYGFHPTAQSPGRVDLAKEFKRKYPNASIDWLTVMNNDSERYLGDAYSYKYNVPVRWDIDFHEDEEIPSFKTKEDLLQWMNQNEEISAELKSLGIPIEKFRWYQTTKDDTLIIKGKVTVICVLEPVMNTAYPTEYMVPSLDNLRLYDTI